MGIFENHWCADCAFATLTGDRVMCPFVEGSCIKLPATIENPDPDELERQIYLSKIKNLKKKKGKKT